MRRLPLVLLGILAACNGDSPRVVAPTTTRDVTEPVTPTTQPVPVAIEITGPETIAPGRSAQFTAMSRFSDGTRQPVSNHVWVFSNELVRMDATGIASAGEQLGEGLVRVRVTKSSGFIDGVKSVLVLPERTYRVVGTVTEEASAGTRVVAARVEVGADPRVAALTGTDGTYRLYGVPANAEVRVARDGYRTHVERLAIADHAVRDFQLGLEGQRLEFAGQYTLTIDVNCGTTSTPVRPPELRHRSYAAVLTQTGSTVEVVLTEPRFRVNQQGRGNRFKGHADAAGATFYLQSFFPYYFPYDPSEYPDLLERTPDGTFLQIDGTAVARKTPAGLSGELVGGVSHYSANFPQLVPGAGSAFGYCWASGSASHRFTLTRR